MTTSKQTNTGKQLIHEIVATDKSKIVSANPKKESSELKKNLHTPKSKPPVK